MSVDLAIYFPDVDADAVLDELVGRSLVGEDEGRDGYHEVRVALHGDPDWPGGMLSVEADGRDAVLRYTTFFPFSAVVPLPWDAPADGSEHPLAERRRYVLEHIRRVCAVLRTQTFIVVEDVAEWADVRADPPEFRRDIAAVSPEDAFTVYEPPDD